MINLNVKILIGILSTSLLLTGCADSTPKISTNPPSQASSESEQNTAENTAGQDKENRRIQNRPDLFGKVKSIIGNEVVLELAEMPQSEEGKGRQVQGEGTSGGESSANQGGQMGVQGGRSAGNRQLKLTGETATVLIPVGVSVTIFSKGEAKEIDIADIYEGSMLQIWFDENDKENQIITRVMVMQGR
ncbi:hypothetical protein QBE52_14805 [Clostridiaceae bacterium 35-E11]